MPLELMGRAPYAPSTAIIAIIKQHRRTPITKFDPVVLGRQVGVSESLIPRTMVALNLLGFSEEDGTVTQEFAALARVPDGELKSALADILRNTYEPVIAHLGGDLSSATPDDLAGAFRSYNPLGQVDRMVQLFTGLMAFVGLMPDTPRRAGVKRNASSGASPAAATKRVKDVTPEKVTPPPLTPPPVVPEAYSRTVRLAGGAGTVTLSGTVNPFALKKGASREFVFAMIDLMDEYEVVNDDTEVSTS